MSNRRPLSHLAPCMLGVAFAFAPSAAFAIETGPAPALPAFVPKDSIFYLGIDVERAVANWESLDLVRLYYDAEFHDFVAPALTGLEQSAEFKKLLALKFFAEQYGFPSIIDGRVELAIVGYGVVDEGTSTVAWSRGSEMATLADHLTHGRSVEPEFVLMIDTAGQESFGASFERLLELDPTLELAEGEADGVPFHVVTLLGENIGARYDLKIWFTFVNDTFLATMRESRLVEVAKAVRTGTPVADALTTDASFDRWRKTCVRGTELLETYVAVKQGMPMMAEFAGDGGGDDSMKSAIELLGLDRAEGIGFRLALENGRLSDTLALVGPQQRSGVLRIMDALQPGAAIVANVRSTSAAHLEFRVDPAMALDVALESIAQVDPDARSEIDRAFEEASKSLGVDFKKDFVASLGADVMISATIPRSGFIPDVVGSVELRDPQKFETALPAIKASAAKASGGAFEFTDLVLKEGPPAFYMKLQGSTPVAPAFAVRNGKLWFTLTTAGLKKLVANLDKGREAEGESSDDIKRCLATTVGQDVGSIAGMLYLDLRGAAEFGLAMAEPFLPAVIDQLPVKLDSGKLPAPETIGSYLSGMLYTLRFNDGVLAIDGSSPLGGLVLPIAGGVAAGLEQQRQMRERAAADRERAEMEHERAIAQDPNQAFVGLLHDPSRKRPGGVLITGVTAGSPAEQGGLQADDLILSIDNETVTANVDLQRILKTKVVGAEVRFRVERANDLETIVVVVGRRGDFIR